MTTEDKTFEIPTVLVLFGITGDLVQKKILKALYKLYRDGYLPEKFQIFGFARKDFDDESLRNYLCDLMKAQSFDHEDEWESFLSMFYYVQGTFEDHAAYDQLADRLGLVDDEWSYCTNKLFYLAVPPKYDEVIVRNLSDSHLTKPCSEEEGYTRVILEKPFGSDYESAQKLDELLGDLFKEEQIYRVDHYLAKETVRNILAFRFGNSFLAPAWNPGSIAEIEVNMFETFDVSERVEFYDSIGAFRDFGKNHMLQLLALFAMHHPNSLDADEIRSKRAEVFDCLTHLNSEQVKIHSRRGQYEGYSELEGTAKDTQTETFFEVRSELTEGPLKGVPFVLRHGKALNSDIKEIKVTFKRSESMALFGDEKTRIDNHDYENVLHYHIHPDESIKIRFYVKKPGYMDQLDRQNFGFSYEQAYGKDSTIDAYEQLLYDIVKGDQTLFVSTEEIMKQWAFVDTLLKTWKEGQPELFIYKKGTMPSEL